MEVMKYKLYEISYCKDSVEKVTDYIEHNYMEELSVKILAHKFAINANYLSTLFKQATGQALVAYITNIRINRACNLLKNTDASITNIAVSVGYQDPLYFFKVFKKTVGKTPLEYRNYAV